MVECQLPKLEVAGSNPVSRFLIQVLNFEALQGLLFGIKDFRSPIKFILFSQKTAISLRFS